jgi:phage host-nuclease inhibitor protein Gam
MDTTTDTVQKPEFHIDSEAKANWLLGKLADIEAEKARIKVQADQRTKELDSDRESLLCRFSEELEAWSRQEAERRRRRTVTLMQGSVSFRIIPASIKVGEYTDALTTARAVCPTAVQTATTLDKKAFVDFARNHFETTGELLPGVERTTEREAFTVKFPGSKVDAEE